VPESLGKERPRWNDEDLEVRLSEIIVHSLPLLLGAGLL
jgi:hypothetical protein